MWQFLTGTAAPRVLVVEDSRTQAAEVVALLRSMECEPTHAASAEEALRLLGETGFDVVLTDVVMPGLSGYELCQRVKASPRGRQTPVILLTSLADPMDLVRGIQCGADSFLSKPLEQEMLRNRIKAALDARKGRPGAAATAPATVLLMGKPITLTPGKEQIFNLLFSTFEHFLMIKKRDDGLLAEARQRLRATEVVAHKQGVEREAVRQKMTRSAAALTKVLDTPLRNIGQAVRTLQGPRRPDGAAAPEAVAQVVSELQAVRATLEQVVRLLTQEDAAAPSKLEERTRPVRAMRTVPTLQ